MENYHKILITGAGGFLSLHLIEQMSNYHIVALARNRKKFEELANYYQIKLPLLEFIEKDILSLTREDTQGIDLIIHNAGRIHNLKKLPYFIRDNVEASQHLINFQIPTVYTSTLSVF